MVINNKNGFIFIYTKVTILILEREPFIVVDEATNLI